MSPTVNLNLVQQFVKQLYTAGEKLSTPRLTNQTTLGQFHTSIPLNVTCLASSWCHLHTMSGLCHWLNLQRHGSDWWHVGGGGGVCDNPRWLGAAGQDREYRDLQQADLQGRPQCDRHQPEATGERNRSVHRSWNWDMHILRDRKWKER